LFAETEPAALLFTKVTTRLSNELEDPFNGRFPSTITQDRGTMDGSQFFLSEGDDDGFRCDVAMIL
jgi:hypothetical protein